MTNVIRTDNGDAQKMCPDVPHEDAEIDFLDLFRFEHDDETEERVFGFFE